MTHCQKLVTLCLYWWMINVDMSTDSFVQDVGDKEFNELLHNESLPVFVDMYADWCVPCKKIAPTVDRLAKEYGERMRFVKVNIDKNPEVARKYFVMSVPTFLILKNKKVQEQMTGANESRLETFVNKHA